MIGRSAPVDEHDRALLRFFRSVTRLPESGCWELTGSRMPSGYEQFYLARLPERRMKRAYGHRWAYETFVGPIQEGLQIDHLCRNRACANPDHLEAVTSQENTLRGVGLASVYASRTRCGHGHPWTPRNTLTHLGTRRCRECHTVQERRRLRRKRMKLLIPALLLLAYAPALAHAQQTAVPPSPVSATGTVPDWVARYASIQEQTARSCQLQLAQDQAKVEDLTKQLADAKSALTKAPPVDKKPSP